MLLWCAAHRAEQTVLNGVEAVKCGVGSMVYGSCAVFDEPQKLALKEVYELTVVVELGGAKECGELPVRVGG